MDEHLITNFPNLVARVESDPRRMESASYRSFGDDFTDMGRTEAELRLGFAAVKDLVNWKMPIQATFPELTDAERSLIGDATVFYAGCYPEIIATMGTTEVTVIASGYYACIGS